MHAIQGTIMFTIKLENRGPFRRANSDRFSHYMSSMNKDNDSVIFDDNVRDLLVDQGFDVDNIYEPRSIYSVEKLFESLSYYNPERNSPLKMDEHVKAGINLAYKVFAKPKELTQHIEALSDSELVNSVKMNKSSGLPLLTSKAESLTYSLNRYQQILSGIKTPNPCIAYKRTQANKKTRLVWGFPLEMTLMEGRFARPLIDQFLKSRTCMAFGLKKPTLGALLQLQVGQHKYKYALDYSKFDSSISSHLIHLSFKILSTWFKKEDLEKYGWDQIIKYFITTPIVMPDGNLYTGKRHGVPSGSYFTQMIDSIVNVIILGALSSKFEMNISWRDLFVLGDDSIFGSNIKVSLQQIADFIKSNFGVTVNVMKSSTDKMEFLGAVWDHGLPTIELDKLLAKALFPETFRNYKDIGKTNGAKQVLHSFSGQYLSGATLAPRNYKFDFFDIGLGPGLKGINPYYMSGSDKFIYTERYGHLLNSMNKKNIVNIPYRMLT